MSNFAEHYVQMLLALPSNTRETNVRELCSEDFQLVLQHVVLNLLSRAEREALVSVVLDKLTKRQKERVDLDEGTSESFKFNITELLRVDNNDDDEFKCLRKTSSDGFRPSSPNVRPRLTTSPRPSYIPSSPAPYESLEHSPDSPAYVPTTPTMEAQKRSAPSPAYVPTTPTIEAQKRSAPSPNHAPISPQWHPTSPSYNFARQKPVPTLFQRSCVSSKYNPVPSKPDPTSVVVSPNTTLKRPQSPNVDQGWKRAKVGERTQQKDTALVWNRGVTPDVEPLVPQKAVQIVDLDPSYVPSDDDDEHSAVLENSKEDTATDILLSVAPGRPLRSISKPESTLYLRVIATHFGDRPYRYEPATNVPNLHSLLQRKFEEDFLWTREGKERYISVLEQPIRYLSAYHCMAMHISPKTGATKCQYEKADRKTGYACDQCITDRRLCVKPATVKGSIELVVYPLPRKLRLGVPYDNKLYWVRQEPDKPASG